MSMEKKKKKKKNFYFSFNFGKIQVLQRNRFVEDTDMNLLSIFYFSDLLSPLKIILPPLHLHAP